MKRTKLNLFGDRLMPSHRLGFSCSDRCLALTWCTKIIDNYLIIKKNYRFDVEIYEFELNDNFWQLIFSQTFRCNRGLSETWGKSRTTTEPTKHLLSSLTLLRKHYKISHLNYNLFRHNYKQNGFKKQDARPKFCKKKTI